MLHSFLAILCASAQGERSVCGYACCSNRMHKLKEQSVEAFALDSLLQVCQSARYKKANSELFASSFFSRRAVPCTAIFRARSACSVKGGSIVDTDVHALKVSAHHSLLADHFQSFFI